MKSVIRVRLCLVASLCAATIGAYGRPYFDKANDLLIAQFDSKPDPDDLMAQVALGCMLKHPDLAGVTYYAVAGAIGTQLGAYIDAPSLFNMSFGPENTYWTDAHDNWAGSLTRVKNKVRPVLDGGGRVWVQEAGPSDFTADWVRQLIADGVAPSVIKAKVLIVQHSIWNEGMTTPADLTYVRTMCDYWEISDGNGANPTGDKDRGIWTPGYTSQNTTWLIQAKAASNPNTYAKDLWTECVARIPADHGNVPINFGGVDFSDCVENWWIFDIGANADTVEKFWNRYVVNTPATVNSLVITSPYHGQTFPVGTAVPMTATATDSNGVVQVDFKLDGTWQNTDTTSPYGYTFTGLSVGSHVLAASKKNGLGIWTDASVTITVTDNLPPPDVLTITTPTNGQHFAVGTPVPITVEASDPDGVERVSFSLNGTWLSADTTAPYTYTYLDLSEGTHLLTAKKKDLLGVWSATSISITVGADDPDPDPDPDFITITSPSNGQTFPFGTPVPMSVEASDPDGIERVAFYRDDDIWLSADTTVPYTYTYENLSVGTHILTAKKKDLLANWTPTSITITVSSVNLDTEPPSVELTSPLDSASFTKDDIVLVSATVTDNTEVQVARVYVDGVLAGIASESPYLFALTGLAVGTRSVEVVGQDISGNTAADSVSIQITEPPPPDGELADCDPVMSAAIWQPATNSAATTPESLLNFGGATNVLVTWNDAGGTNATVTYTLKRTLVSDNGNVQLFFFGDLAYSPSASGAASNLNLTVAIKNSTAPVIGSVRFALRQGGNIFYTPGVYLGTVGSGMTLSLSGLHTVTLATNGVTHTAGATWLSYPEGATLNLVNGDTIEFGIGLLATFPDVLTASRGAILDNFCLGVNTAAPLPDLPLLQMTQNAGVMLLSWKASSHVLEQTEQIESNNWVEVARATSPHIALPDSPRQFYRIRAAAVEPPPSDPLVYWATTNFPSITAGAVPAYKDAARNALAIDAATESYRGLCAAAETTFAGTAGDYDITITTLTETDGECTYRLLVNGVQRGTFTNPRSSTDYQEVNHTWSSIAVPAGATIRVEFNTHSNGLIPEAGGFAWARGRWRRLTLAPNISAPSGAWIESDGLVVMEAEKTTSPLGNWAFSTTITPGWTGTGHLQFNGNNPSGGNANSPLTYQFKITQTGTYRLFLRARKNLEGAREDYCNDCFVRMAGNYTAGPGVTLSLLQNDTKFFGGEPDMWVWGQKLDDVNGVKYDALYNFTAGEVYTLTMSGRSQRFNVDRIALRLEGVADSVWKFAPESYRAP